MLPEHLKRELVKGARDSALTLKRYRRRGALGVDVVLKRGGRVAVSKIAARVHGPSGLPVAIIVVGSIEDLIAVIECPAKGCVAL
jgi:hypothetical protein